MSKIVNVSSGNYRLKVQSGGKIFLDTGELVGDVFVTGNLTVLGTTTTIESTTATITDNILVLNQGETGNGITLSTSGIEIDRGPTTPNAQFLFDETIGHYDPILNDTKMGTFVAKTDDDLYSGLVIASVSAPPSQDFTIDFAGYNQVAKIEGTDPNNYVALLDATLSSVALGLTPTASDNYLVNKKYVNAYITSGVEVPGVADVDRIYKKVSSVYKSYVQANSNSTITFAINGTSGGYIRSQISASGLDVDNINLFTNTINNSSLSNNLILTATNNHVEIDSVLDLDNQGSDITSSIGGTTQIYTKSAEGPGRSGIYFTNNTPYGSNLYNNDELVSKNRAVLLSILL